MCVQVEDGCHSIMLMSMSTVQSHASLSERQAEDTDGGKKEKDEVPRKVCVSVCVGVGTVP